MLEFIHESAYQMYTFWAAAQQRNDWFAFLHSIRYNIAHIFLRFLDIFVF